MSCQAREDRKISTLPPPCYHCRPPRFHCPKYGCPPPEPCPLRQAPCQEPCEPLRCGQPPRKPTPPPTICIARPCPDPVFGKPRCLSSPPKIKPPNSSVRFCIQKTCQGETYCPCYQAEMPCCTSRR